MVYVTNCYTLLLRWISSFIRNRTVKVRILGHTSREIAINYGVPQGSPISPLLFLLYMSKLPKLLPNTRIILSCTKSVRVLFERKKSNRLKPPDVTYNGQVIPSSSSIKFIGITFDSALTFRSHFRSRHSCPSSPP